MDIQLRDVKLLSSLARNRFLTSEHLHALHFTGRSLRAAQMRLKELFDDDYVERTYLMPPVDGVPRRVRPLYSLVLAGAELVAPVLGVPVKAVPHTRAANAIGYEHLLHELVVADFLVAAEAALRGTPGLRSVATLRDHDLRSALTSSRRRGLDGEAVVPDGALTVDHETLLRPTTLYLEVVHAGVKGGNGRLVDKLERYARLQRAAYFARVFDHDQVRAVVVTSPSAERLDNLQRFAARVMRHGRRFVWFARAPRHSSRTHPPTTFTATSLAETTFIDVDGQIHRFGVEALH